MAIFSNKFLETIQQSAKICLLEKSAEISPRHLLAALEKVRGGLAFDVLAQLTPLLKQAPDKTANSSELKQRFSRESLQMIERAGSIAFQHGHFYIGTEHLLSALLEKHDVLPPDIAEKTKKHLTTILKSSSHVPDFAKIFQLNPGKYSFNAPLGDASGLAQFAIDLTEEKNHQETNPVIGREKELERLIQILCRKDKNNPIILGEAGVGKTALIEGLAKKIAERNVPLFLLNKKILSLDLGLMVAGTIYRGEFEERLKAVMDEVAGDPNVILFIDELHNIIGAGSAHGAMDAANLLKPLLARGRLRCIGATTPEEFKKHIEPDPALERRFQPIYLSEPSAAETLSILDGVKNNYQNFHQVFFTDEALKAAVSLSVRYIQDKLLPDKAIDLIDETAAKVKIKQQSSDDLLKKQLEIEEQLKNLRQSKSQAVYKENFNEAIKIKEQERILSIRKKDLAAKREKQREKIPIFVSAEDIIELVAQKTKIPISEIAESEYARLNKIKKQLQGTVIGQNEHIERIMKTISRAKLGLADENRPLASFLVLGASGVGKTMLAKELAKLLFSKIESFIQLDMSEFHDQFQATKLIGAPAGYVGYRESNKFTDLVKKNPHSLILLDEIEKAHPDVLDLLLQVLEHGHLTDSAGKKVNFKNTVIYMTSNALSKELGKKQLGFGGHESDGETSWENELKKHFKPELINRINQFLIFNSLDEPLLEQILKRELQTLKDKLTNKGISLTFSNNVYPLAAKLCAEHNCGARAVQKVIDEHIKQPLLDKIMASAKKNFRVKIINDKIAI